MLPILIDYQEARIQMMTTINPFMENPLLKEWETPFGTPPFDIIKTEHYVPATEEAIRKANEEIKKITENSAPPDFKNSIEALENCGETVGKIASVLFNLNSAETSKELQSVARKVSPLLARFSNDITLNEHLFKKVKSVFDSQEKEELTIEQKMLLERKYRSFLLGGAGLDETKKIRFREISEELASLGLKFEENVLEETNSFELHITGKEDLAGLPEGIIETAAMEAAERKKEGWVFTLHFPSYIPFMQYSEKRELREKMLKVYTSRSFRGNEHDNRELVRKIANLRLEMAAILGFEDYAEMVLGDRMAENSSKVNSFLDELYRASHTAAVRDFNNILKFAGSKGHQGDLERWDWAFYTEKLKKARFEIDDEILKPYFILESVQKAIFSLAEKLYGIKFMVNKNIPVYHPEVSTWEITDSDGRFLAVFYADFHPRPGKSGGAWMTCYREQRKENGIDIRPFVSIVTNFSRPTETRPSLLTFSELTTFLHEFGHSLHAILTDCTYESLSGTNVARDFVELPSQFMENWAYEKEWLNTWAAHYKTGEMIPEQIIDRIREASTFNEGYACERQLGFGFLDMAWHTLKSPFDGEVENFEKQVMKKTDLFPEVKVASISCSFAHLFGGGYAAGYYGYKWAEVLDADAFWYFRENGVFNSEIAASFRKNILEKGATDKPMNLYVRFRGREPGINAFLERSGLK
jgi:peptidyl-dipeptidase Dcp